MFLSLLNSIPKNSTNYIDFLDNFEKEKISSHHSTAKQSRPRLSRCFTTQLDALQVYSRRKLSNRSKDSELSLCYPIPNVKIQRMLRDKALSFEKKRKMRILFEVSMYVKLW